MVSKKIDTADVFFLEDRIQLNQSLIFLFALNDTSIEVNKEKISLNKNDLLLIENKDQFDILLKVEHSSLVGSLGL